MSERKKGVFKLSLNYSEEIKDFYERSGYAILEKCIQPTQIKRILNEIETISNAEAKRHLVKKSKSDKRVDSSLTALFSLGKEYRSEVYHVFQSMISLYELGASEQLQSIARILGLKCPNLRNVALRIDIPNEDKFLQPLHQDVRGMRSENAINFWIPLHDVDVENGALCVYPGSHRLNAIQCEERNAGGYQVIRESQIRGFHKASCEIEAGDVLVFHPYTVHASNRNRSKRIRWTVTVRYDDATEMAWMITGQNPYRILDIQQAFAR